MQYKISKNNTVQYLLDYEPTPEQLAELGCDSYELYEDPVETPEQQKARVKQALISSSDLSLFDIEWVTFTDKEIGDIILQRVFEWNPHGQSSMLAKTSAYLMSVMSGDLNDELLADIQSKQARINEVRAKFNLSII